MSRMSDGRVGRKKVVGVVGKGDGWVVRGVVGNVV